MSFEALETFVYNYGYLAILIGAIFEGEASLLAGGLAAQAGYLALPWVIFVAFLGTLFGDQAYFLLGRWQRRKILDARPSWKDRVNKAERLVENFRTPLILVFRFLFGIRTFVILAMGMSPIPTTQFAVLNVLGAMIWAVAVGIAGYFFGSVFETLLGGMKSFELPLVALPAGIVLLLLALRHTLKRRRGKG